MDIPIILLVLLSIAALSIPIIHLLFGQKALGYIRYLTALSLSISLLLLLGSLVGLISQESTLPHLIRTDLLGSFFGFIVILVSLFVVISYFDYVKVNPN